MNYELPFGSLMIAFGKLRIVFGSAILIAFRAAKSIAPNCKKAPLHKGLFGIIISYIKAAVRQA